MRFCSILFLIMSFCTTVAAQPATNDMPASNTMALQHYTTKDELRGNYIRSLFEDRQGILWVGTNKGISLFDGQTIRPLITNPQSPLFSAVIFDITQAEDDSFWIATHYRGVFHYFPRTHSYIRYGEQNNNLGLISQAVRALLIDKSGTVWAGSDKGLHRFDAKAGRFNHIEDPTTFGNAPSSQINAMVESNSDHLWLGTANGLVYFNPKAKPNETAFTRFHNEPGKPTTLANNKVLSLMMDDSQKLWVGTANGLSTTTNNNGAFANINHGLCTTPVTKLMFDARQHLWLGTAANGVCLGNKNATHFNTFRGNSDDTETLRSNQIGDMLQDREGNVWLGTRAGLSVWKRDVAAVEVFALKSMLGRTIKVQTVFDAPDDTLILITAKQTLKVNKKTLQALQSKPVSMAQSGARTIVYSLYMPGYGAFALKNRDPALYRLNPVTLDYQPTGFALSTDLHPYNNVSLHQVKEGQLAVATDKNTHVIALEDFSVSKLFGEITTHAPVGVLAIHQQNNRLWTCPAHHEFTAYDLSLNQWQPVMSQMTSSETLKCNRLIHSQKGVWGISLRTVFRLGPDSNEVLDELDEHDVSTLLEVDNDLWLIKNDELIRYPLQGGQKLSIGLTMLDNVSHSARNNSFYDATSRQLYIPTSKRLLRVNLDQISRPNQTLAVNLRAFSLFNHAVDVWSDPSIDADAAITHAQSVQLDHSQYMFQLSFAADSLGAAQTVKYRYRLKGFDRDWIDTSADKAFALYSGVSDGHYKFEVQAAWDTEHWPATSKSIDITITPAWWNTWWAYVVYVVLFLTVVLSIVWLAYRRQLAEKDRQSVLAIAQAKEQFFANISHEFRTPLTLILGPITRLREKTKEATTRSSLALVERNAHRLATMVDQILDLAKLQSFKENPVRVQNVADVVDFVVQSFQALVNEQQIKLSVDNRADAPMWVEVLPDTLEKILTNLLSNAFKYSSNGASVTVILTTQNNRLSLAVQDTGSGMEPDDLAIVFDRFTRINESSHGAPGTGIGLALVKELVERHNGTITVESELGTGSCFTVSIPLSQPRQATEEEAQVNTQVIDTSIAALSSAESQSDEQPADEEQQATTQANNKPHILIIEDNADMREYVTSLLEQDYQCSTAENGQLGLEQAIKTVPDLIISDVMMPVMDGFEVAKKVRDEQCTSHIPLILLTAKDDVDSRMKGWRQNIDDYIAKPFHRQELSLRVENLLSVRNILKKRFASEVVTKGINVSNLKKDDLGDKNVEFIQQFEKVVSENFHLANFSRANAASHMALSERQLHRKLAALVDYNFTEYLRQYRLQKACKMLGRGFQVARISDEVGFSSPSYFSSCFKAEFGMTVRQYEKNLPEEAS